LLKETTGGSLFCGQFTDFTTPFVTRRDLPQIRARARLPPHPQTQSTPSGRFCNNDGADKLLSLLTYSPHNSSAAGNKSSNGEVRTAQFTVAGLCVFIHPKESTAADKQLKKTKLACSTDHREAPLSAEQKRTRRDKTVLLIGVAFDRVAAVAPLAGVKCGVADNFEHASNDG
jgi:hypothetical protein